MKIVDLGWMAGCALLVATGRAAAQVDDAAAIDALRQGMIDAFNKGDIPALLQWCDPEIVTIWQNNEVCKGGAQLQAFYDRVYKGSNRLVEKVTTSPQVDGRLIQGDRAVSWGQFNDSYLLTEGSTIALNSRFTATLAKRDGAWKVIAFHASANVFDNPVLAAGFNRVALVAGGAAGVVGLALGAGLVTVLHRRRKQSA